MKKLCGFSAVLANRAVFGSSEDYCNFTKGLFFSCFHGQKCTFSAHRRVRIKKLINIKLRNMSILAIKCTFLGQNWLNIYNQLWMRKNDVHVSYN